jgi:hypothetical protein
MRAPNRHLRESSADCVFDDADEQYELMPGERIGPPVASTRGKTMLWGVLVVLIALGGGWALLGDQAIWSTWLPAENAAVSASVDRNVPLKSTASAMAITTAPASVEPTSRPTVLDVAPSNLQQSSSSKAATLTTAALPPANKVIDEPSSSSARSPTADPADPYQMRAVAVGLHPGLSRVLLSRLSPTDYRNASIAIQTAVAETPDSAVFVWPRQRKPELALFEVRFVPGASPDCRRYVVTVAKDGWSTTALPMEKCGPRPRMHGSASGVRPRQ